MPKKDRYPASLQRLEDEISYRFQNRDLLVEALTHPSYNQLPGVDVTVNQRMEFLGDAVLSAVLAEELFNTFPGEREGVLSRNRSALSRGSRLADLARDLSLPEHLRLSPGDEQAGGRERDSTLEDALEALVGAIFLDSGYEVTRQVLNGWYGDLEARLEEDLPGHNPKGDLQEKVQSGRGSSPSLRYRVARTTGPEHDKLFRVDVLVGGKKMGGGSGSSRKEAETEAARNALELILQEEEEGAAGEGKSKGKKSKKKKAATPEPAATAKDEPDPPGESEGEGEGEGERAKAKKKRKRKSKSKKRAAVVEEAAEGGGDDAGGGAGGAATEVKEAGVIPATDEAPTPAAAKKKKTRRKQVRGPKMKPAVGAEAGPGAASPAGKAEAAKAGAAAEPEGSGATPEAKAKTARRRGSRKRPTRAGTKKAAARKMAEAKADGPSASAAPAAPDAPGAAAEKKVVRRKVARKRNR